MKLRALSPILLLVSLLGSAPTQSDDSAAAKGRLIALENAWNRAQITRDQKALDGLVADTFYYTDTDGTVMNKTQFLADSQDPAYHATSAVNTDVKVNLYQNTAVVLGTYRTKGTYKGKTFDHVGRFTDTWIYENYKWQCVASHTTLITK